nr:uncharacterized protein LOC6635623 isoform X9 [Drosophila virilis]
MRNTNSNMQFSTHRRSLYWLLGLCLLLFETGLTNAQSKRTPRVTNSRSFSTNVKSTSSNGVSFDCPEEFGYYPHPTDCTQYYVCVFGGALLESCTGGLMYSHELQTCDWPRNVGCELVDSGTSATSTEVGNASRNKPQQHVPSRIRFGAAFTSPAATQKTITVPPQYHRSPPQIIPAQVQHIPPPPELAVSPNPVVTSRGQPKSLLDSQEEIAKLYAEAQETLPPVEEEESDRQQRVYRGQPSTVSQVQRDRDGILHQASINAIPNHGKIGSYTFGTAYRNNNRNRGSSIFTNQDRDTAATPNRGTHPPRTRPTLKPAGTIVSKAQEFVDIYRYPPSRPDPLYPQPTPDKTAAKCRKDVCLLPDCYCGGKDIPGGLNVSDTPQIVLITFDDAISTINIDLYDELFNNKSRKNPNGCPLRATFYLSHEWTDYGMVQDLYSDGHEMASHTVSHSFGEQFSQKKWTREIAGQREILAAYGGVKLSDVRGMRAPFLSVGGNKMYKMLYDSNFTYDSSMPVYENRPPSWPYTLDYKIFHDCMIPPCPTRSYPGVWQVPMVMWQDLNGGRCSMGDACSNPSDSEGVTKMIMKNFERHYTTNRAPFGLFYHAAWFTQPHHKEGFIKFLDAINAMQDVWIITNWQALQWVRDPTPTSRINSFQPFQCDYSDRPKRCNNPKVCNLWHKSGVRYMKTCQPCPDIYPWTGKSGIRSSRIDNEVEEPSAQN